MLLVRLDPFQKSEWKKQKKLSQVFHSKKVATKLFNTNSLKKRP